eukprot:1059372-Pelagomonas_calceolata.AAC.4
MPGLAKFRPHSARRSGAAASGPPSASRSGASLAEGLQCSSLSKCTPMPRLHTVTQKSSLRVV